ncbi:hypothetical protein GL270_14170 [Aeromonas veronii]|uniref:O antigen polymerase n=1 Tax=Aeromonas hydrophila TaxID=644 RepID=A0A346ACM4_AERHY|nr:hypothetical protein [Aeromonas veronii]AXL04986.1 O antigen polymerase [Aeromonas hydrophila]MBW3782375.1 hypothetical protein [Aeromonas veronii]OKP40060.1 hypothetical protein BJP22_13035 [Aeromonas veronii]
MKKYSVYNRLILQFPIFFFLAILSILYLNIYYDVAISNVSDSVERVGTLVNLHDHRIYIQELEYLSNNEVSYELNNDFGIAFIYHLIYEKTQISSVIDIYVFSLIFNLMVLWLAFFYYNKVCSRHKLPDLACLVFFLNFSFVYFIQLVNKDMLTIFILIYTLYFGIKRHYINILLIIPIAFLVRQQLALCLFTFLFLINVKNTLFWVIISYIITSLAAGHISANLQLISAESMGSGFSSFLMMLNSEYYIGNLLLNPVRVIQYFLSVPQSLIYVFSDEGLDLAAGLRALTLPLEILSFLFFFRSLFNIKVTLNSELKVYFLLTYSFFICWLLNPTINARYLMLILPIMVLGYFYQSEIVKKNDK